ncbi:MAG TPA: hypothetical protein VFQ61_38800 [Polyangiaceae bacterium]|nr:hypothetical protein [Polyangiaceae bacterium]
MPRVSRWKTCNGCLAFSTTSTPSIGPGHILLETRFGDFDCLGAIDGNRSYEEASLRVLGLGELLQIKKRTGRPKDLAGIPYIEATIAELSRKT